MPTDPDRYVNAALLGSGGMGVVRAVTDTLLDRTVAVKTLHPHADALARQRFLDEARITAQLDHPGVVAVHDLGFDPEGVPFLTMQRVDGLTLRERLLDPAASTQVRRHLDLLVDVAGTVAYAHEKGIVHRDLKPENIMVGRFGEVRVLDWGIARRVDDTPSTRTPGGFAPQGVHTATDVVTGTPAYLAPEQVTESRVGPPADVYALGAMLVECVTGRPIRTGRDAVTLMGQAMQPVQLPDALPDALAALARDALALEPTARPTALRFAEVLSDWVQGAERADLARARAAEAEAAFAEVQALAAREDELTVAIRDFDNDRARITERWAAEDARDAAALARTLLDTEVDRLLGVALSHAPELGEVHAAVARVARRRCERAEDDGRRLDAARHTVLVRRHDRGEHAAWLQGDGHLTLHTIPSGVQVVARRLEEHGRRLVAGARLPLGTTPLERVSLPQGSWVVEAAGTSIPVFLRRGEHWDGVAPGCVSTAPVPLLTPDEGEVYVPAGPYVAGGDPEARNPRHRARVWVDGFLLRTHPVTHAEYLVFLDALERDGRGADAARFAPQHTSVGGGIGAAVYPVVDGRRTLPEADWATLPVFLVDWYGAVAYAAWEAERTGLPWRLPTFAEREKAGRGVDGRLFPWGNTWHPDWSNTGLSFAEPQPVSVHDFPLDVSPYGARGLAGNVSDWLLDGFTHALARPARASVIPRDEVYATFAGGAWNSGVVYARSSNLGRYGPDNRVTSLGFRLARSLSGA
jgi:formylglycine-generating enzyme required for sulfatase activity